MTFDVDTQGLGRVLAAVPQFIAVVDRDGIFRYINHAQEGFDIREFVGTHSSLALAPESVASHDAALRSVFATGKTEEYEVEVPAPDGSSLWYRSQLFPLGDDAPPEAAVIVGSDITELKRVQAEAGRLRQLVPLCAWCDRIRTGEDIWRTVEAYLEETTGSRVTHGLCSDCLEAQVKEADKANGDAA